MTSALQSQLAKARDALGTVQPQIAPGRGKPSLLFSPQEAAGYDIHAIYGLALKGEFHLSSMRRRLAGCERHLTPLIA